jgi:hypothetical protein
MPSRVVASYDSFEGTDSLRLQVRYAKCPIRTNESSQSNAPQRLADEPVASGGTYRSVQTRCSFASGKNTIMTRDDYYCNYNGNLWVQKKIKRNKFT